MGTGVSTTNGVRQASPSTSARRKILVDQLARHRRRFYSATFGPTEASGTELWAWARWMQEWDTLIKSALNDLQFGGGARTTRR